MNFCPLSPPPTHQAGGPGPRFPAIRLLARAGGREAFVPLACCFLIFHGRAAVRGWRGAAQCHHHLHRGLLWALGPCPPAASTVPARLGDVAPAWQQAQGAHRAPAAVVVLSLGLEAGGPGRMRGSCPWCFGWGGQGRDVHGARGRMQGAGASTGCALCLQGGMHSAAPPRDARHSTHRGCTEQHPRGMHRMAPTRAARHCNHAGGTERHPRGMHIADPGQAAHHGTHTGCTSRHPHATHTAAPGRDAWCRVRDARGGTERRCWQCREQRAHRQSAASFRAPTPSSSSTRCLGGGHMMGSDVGAPRVSHATACCHPHGHCGQTPGTLGTAGCCW